MPTQTIHYSRPLTSAFFKEASHDDLKWTINYLITLLEHPENSGKVETESTDAIKTDTAKVTAHDFYGLWKDNAYDCQEMIDDIKNNRSFKKEIIEL